MPKKTRTASDKVTIEGLPESVPLWSATSVHPLFKKDDIKASIANGSAYADTNRNHDKGEPKSVTQYASDKTMTKLVDDGYTKDRDKQVGLKYNGQTLRWLESDLTDEDKILIDEKRGHETLCKGDDLVDRMVKMISVTMNAQNVRITKEDFSTFSFDLQTRLEAATTITANKIADTYKTDGGAEKVAKPRKYGV